MQPEEPFWDKAVTRHQRDLEDNLRSSPLEPILDLCRLRLLQVVRAWLSRPFKHENTRFEIYSFDKDWNRGIDVLIHRSTEYFSGIKTPMPRLSTVFPPVLEAPLNRPVIRN